MLKLKGIVLALVGVLFVFAVNAQNGAQITADVLTHNFGTISEADGPAIHVFKVTNTGTAPLVITRITASCGCAQPEWSKEPIAPGSTGEVTITFNPQGRPGPFHKTISIYSNGKKGTYTLAIRGNVTPKPIQPILVYPYSIGELKLTTKTVLFSSLRPNETLGERISVINEGDTPVSIQLGKTPNYVLAEVHPLTIEPGKTGEISLLMDGRSIKRKGRIAMELPITIHDGNKEESSGTIQVAANLIDNFSKLSPSEKDKAPVAELSTLVEFGQITEKGSILPLMGGKVSATFEITNTGKSPLLIYSVTSDDDRLDISGGKKELKPGAKATFKISVRPKDVKAKMEALVNVVCNDPNGPVRLIKVTAYK